MNALVLSAVIPGRMRIKKSRHQKNDAGFLLVGMTRLELATPASRTQYATNCATSRIASAKLQLILEICNKNRKKYTFLKKNTKKLAQFKKSSTFALAIRK